MTPAAGDGATQGDRTSDPELPPGSRLLLGLAAVAVAFAAADTYVVVLALPDMMAAAGLSADAFEKAAPIVSGFLLGYVAVLPLVGRLADLRGRVPVLVGSLCVFAVGSLLTAAAYDLPSMVTGRFLQGVGGGGLVPATLALVADLYPAHRRGVPLGVVGAVQEIGSVLGPLYGAVVLAVGSWRAIFWVNLAVGLVLAAALRSPALGRPSSAAPAPRAARGRDWPGAVLAAVALALLLLVMQPPETLLDDVTLGLAFLPLVGESRWLAPAGLAFLGVLVLLLVWCWTARRPLLDLRAWVATGREVDATAAALLAASLGGVVLAFATADPREQVLSAGGPWWLALSVAAAALFVLRNRRSSAPLVPAGTVTATAAWGALGVSFLVGVGLIAALTDVPVFARLSAYPDSQLGAALVLVRLLVALPVGALLGGWLTHRAPAGVVTAVGMAAACAGFLLMSRWGLEALDSPWATVPLVLTGLGFGLALAPVNAALLATTEVAVHGVASALLVVARMVGMLVGISALTTVGLRRYYTEQGDLPAPMEVCGDGASRCDDFTRLLQEAALTQVHTVFLGAAASCALAGALALVVFRGAGTRAVEAPLLGAPVG